MKIIQHPDIQIPAGHYSPLIAHNGTLFFSGQLPFDDHKNIPEGIKAQTLQVLKNMEHLLQCAGSSITDIIQVKLYIPDVELWDAVNQVYKSFFGSHKPTRTVVPTRDLHYGALIELEAMAVYHGT